MKSVSCLKRFKAEIVDESAAMKGNRDVINQLNQVLYHHLTAINQYSYVHACLMIGGIEQLGSANIKISIRQMKHATKLLSVFYF